MGEASKIAAIDRFLEIIIHARERPHMYFDPIGPSAMTHWLWGLKTGLHDWAAVPFDPEHRKAALDARGLEMKAAPETDQLEARGLSPAEIVDELLAIEIEQWQSYRNSLNQEP